MNHHDLERRLAALERSNRRWRCGTLSAAAPLLAAAALGLSAQDQPGTLRATRLEIVDDEGLVQLRLTTSRDHVRRLGAEQGIDELTLSRTIAQTPRYGQFELFDADAKTLIEMGRSRNGGGTLVTLSPAGHVIAALGETENHEGVVATFAPGGLPLVELATLPDGGGSLRIHDAFGRALAELSHSDGAGMLRLDDEQQRPLVLAGRTNANTGGVLAMDPEANSLPGTLAPQPIATKPPPATDPQPSDTHDDHDHTDSHDAPPSPATKP